MSRACSKLPGMLGLASLREGLKALPIQRVPNLCMVDPGRLSTRSIDEKTHGGITDVIS